MTDTSQPTPTPPPLPHGSENVEVWEVLQKLWKKMGTIERHGGRDGKIVCTPPDLKFLLNRPNILGYDPMDYLTGWCNTAVACCLRVKLLEHRRPPDSAGHAHLETASSRWRSGSQRHCHRR
jgi:hypothetical protein